MSYIVCKTVDTVDENSWLNFIDVIQLGYYLLSDVTVTWVDIKITHVV